MNYEQISGISEFIYDSVNGVGDLIVNLPNNEVSKISNIDLTTGTGLYQFAMGLGSLIPIKINKNSGHIWIGSLTIPNAPASTNDNQVLSVTGTAVKIGNLAVLSVKTRDNNIHKLQMPVMDALNWYSFLIQFGGAIAIEYNEENSVLIHGEYTIANPPS